MRDRKEYMKKYYKDNREKILKQHKKWLENNPEYFKKYSKEYYQSNYEKVLKRQRRWREENPECIRAKGKRYRKTEEGKANSQRGHIKTRAKERNIINTLTAEEWLNILKQYNFKCAYCGRNLLDLFIRPERDHIIPINRGGNNTKENIVPACRSCNAKKHNKILSEVI